MNSANPAYTPVALQLGSRGGWGIKCSDTRFGRFVLAHARTLLPCAVADIPGLWRQGMRNDFKPAPFDPHSEDGESVAFQLFVAGGAPSVDVLLGAIQAAVRNSLSSVKNGTEHCAPGRPVRVPLRLRQESRMTLGCITQRLRMKSKTYLSPLLCLYVLLLRRCEHEIELRSRS